MLSDADRLAGSARKASPTKCHLAKKRTSKLAQLAPSSLLRSSMSQEILSEVRLEVDQSATALRKAFSYTSADVCADS